MSHFIASTDRSLALRLRPDVVAVGIDVAGASMWVLKDPLSLEHFHFSAEEYALIELLREHVSLTQLKRDFERRFPPRSIGEQEIWAFVSQLHEAGLLISDAPGQSDELLERDRRERFRDRALSVFQLTAIRFRGVNPDKFLTALHNCGCWLFSKVALFSATAIVLLALSIVVGHWGEFRTRLPELSAFADARNLIWLLAAIGGVKVLHELGHALTCKHFGGEVNEMGFMLLVFAPCLYCDVTDAWQLPNKWHRILISAAGILVELVVASIATIVWWYAEPGVVQLVALDVMLIATVSTLLVNGNPLLRYDGYYILSDLVESPNLWQRSRDVLNGIAARWLFCGAADDDVFVPHSHRLWLSAYGMASKLYMAFVLVAILWSLVRILHPLRLEAVAYAVGLVSIGGACVGPMIALSRFANNPIRRRDLRSGRLATFSAIALVAAVVLLAWPVTYYVHAPLALLPAGATRVYATVDGLLADAVAVGAKVESGQSVARLENPALKLELTRLTGEYELQRSKLADLERLRTLDAEANSQLPTAKATLDDLAQRLADRRRDAERLTLKTPLAGTVIAAPRIEPPKEMNGRLPKWSGEILDDANRGALVELGTLVCLVGDPSELEAVLLVDDTDVARLQSGQAVRLRLDQWPGRVLDGEVVSVARHDVASHDSAAARAELESFYAGLVPPGRSSVHYQARVRLKACGESAAIGGHGEAKIAAERITLAQWIVRRLAQTFRLPT